MSMNVPSSGAEEPMCDVNTTPLIDVMLVLLVMLIVTLPTQNHAVKLDMPVPNNNPPPPTLPEVIDIEIDFDGTIVYNGTPVPSPNRRARYDVVANVMASAQRSRLVKMGFTNVAEFRD
jgi:biopolymer transport protein ExbD